MKFDAIWGFSEISIYLSAFLWDFFWLFEFLILFRLKIEFIFKWIELAEYRVSFSRVWVLRMMKHNEH